MDRPLVFLDTETATQRGAPHLLELGAVRVVAGEAVEHFSRLVLPAVPIEPEATAVHGIDDEEVRQADPATSVLADFAAFAGDDWLVAHNARADAWVLGFEFARAELDAPSAPVLDSLALARRFLPDAPDHKLETLIEYLELETGETHRALPDAVAAWQVVEACIERHGGWTQISEAELLKHAGTPVTIRTAAPALPRRRPATVRRLERARKDAEPVRLYYGESKEHAAMLEVFPRLLFQMKDKGYLEGECGQSGLLKTYRIDRIQAVR